MLYNAKKYACLGNLGLSIVLAKAITLCDLYYEMVVFKNVNAASKNHSALCFSYSVYIKKRNLSFIQYK